MAEDKVLVLHYAEPNDDQLRGLCKMISKVEIEIFLRSEKLKIKDLCKGRIKMIYSEHGKDNIINKDTGEVFKGTIMFVGFDRQDIVNLTDKQMSAIRCMYRKAG